MFRGRRSLVGLAVVGAAGWGLITAVASAPDAAAAPIAFAFTGATQTYVVPSDGSVCSVTVDLAVPDAAWTPR